MCGSSPPPSPVSLLATPATPETLRGIVLVVLSASVFALVDGLSKMLAETQSVGQIVCARYAIALPVIVLLTHVPSGAVCSGPRTLSTRSRVA